MSESAAELAADSELEYSLADLESRRKSQLWQGVNSCDAMLT